MSGHWADEFLEWIRLHSCCVCGSPGVLHEDGMWRNDPSHIKSRGAGGEDFGNVVPKCRFCHSRYHSMGRKKFQEKHQINLSKIAKVFTKQFFDQLAEEDDGESYNW